MKILYPERQLTVAADAENANFPDDNLLDDHPKQLWKGTGNSHTIEFTTGAGSEVCALFNTNASSITVSVRLGNKTEWESGTAWESGTSWYTTEPSPSTLYDLNAEGVGRLWAEYTAIDAPHIIELVLTAAAGTVLEAGCFKSGDLNTFDDPLHGVNEGLRDFSVKKQLNSGGWYIRKKDVVRDFDFIIYPDRDSDFYTFMHSIVQLVGPGPLAWRLIHQGLTDWEWVVYGMMETMPQGNHSNPTKSKISVSITEVV